MECVLPARKTT